MPEQIELLAIGDSSIDEFLQVEDGSAEEGERNGQVKICFYHGTKIPIDKYETSIAGNAINVGMGTQKLGMKTYVYTEIGDDTHADRIIKELSDAGINTTYCIKNTGTETDIHPIIIYGGERTIFIYHAKRNYEIKNWPVPKWLYFSSIGRHFEEFHKVLVQYLSENREIGVVFNPGTYHIKAGINEISEVLSYTHVLILNKEEAQILVGEQPLEELHTKLQEYGPKVTIITDGNNGSSGHDGKELFQIPVFEEGAIVADKTGAGDAYSAGVVAALFHKKPLKEAMFWGSINSSYVIRKVGAVNGQLTQKEVEEFIKKI